jgi:hypothetical protein
MNNWLMTEKFAYTREAEWLAEAEQARLAKVAHAAQPPAEPGLLTRLFARLADGLAALVNLLRTLADSARRADADDVPMSPAWPSRDY